MNRILLSVALIATISNTTEAQTMRRLYASDSSIFFEGKVLFTNPEQTSGRWRNYERNGYTEPDISLNRYSSVPSAERLFGNARFFGEVKMYYNNGKVALRQNYDNGIADGKYEAYYIDGSPAITGAYKNGMQEGEWKYFNKNGKLMFRGVFKAFTQDQLFAIAKGETLPGMGKASSRSNSMYQTSKMSQEKNSFSTQQTFLEGRYFMLNGKYEFFYADGERQAVLNYKDGIAEGVWELWNPRGKMTHKIEHKAGEVIAVWDVESGKMLAAEDLRKKEEVSYNDRAISTMTVEGDPNGIDPGLVAYGTVEAPPAPSIYEYVSQMPEAPYNVDEYIKKNLKYPQRARESNVEGRVIVRFVVKEDGSISELKVVRGIGSGCDEEAIRVLKSMPKWKPGKQNGKAVAVYFTKPVTFKLDEQK